MKENKNIKISLIILVILIIIVIAIAAYSKVVNLKKEKNNSQSAINIFNTTNSSYNDNNYSNNNIEKNNIENNNIEKNNTENNNSKDTTNSSSVSYIILELEDIEAQGLEYKNKKITNKQKIDSLMKIIDSATSYTEENFGADLGDCPPCAKIYLSNGKSYTVAAGDQINDNGKTVNLMTKWYNEDGSDKTLYKVDTKLGEYIEKLFND